MKVGMLPAGALEGLSELMDVRGWLYFWMGVSCVGGSVMMVDVMNELTRLVAQLNKEHRLA